MGRSNSGDRKMIFRTNLSTLNIGLMKCGRAKWQEAEETRKRFQYCIDSVRRNSLPPSSSRSFRTQSYWSFITGQCRWFWTVSSKYIYHVGCAINLHSIINREAKIWAKDRQYWYRLWILWIKITKILRRSTWKHRVMHGTCIQRGRNIKTLCNGSKSNLLKRNY